MSDTRITYAVCWDKTTLYEVSPAS